MTRLDETAQWEEQIYEIRTVDTVLGGTDGISNRQAAQLANRTQWLKDELLGHGREEDPHPQYSYATARVASDLDALSGKVTFHESELTAHAGELGTHAQILMQLQDHADYLLSTLSAPSGSQLVFVQSAAPTGWTKVTQHHDKALRIVNGVAGSGGSMAFSSVFASRAISGSVGNTTLTVAQMPSHAHGGVPARTSTDWSGFEGSKSFVSGSTSTGASGGNGAHTHSLSVNAMNMQLQYVDAIIARKD